jgi:hypothetical protein
MRRILVPMAAAALLAVMSAPASAVPPLHERFPNADATLTDHCTFDVFIDVVEDKETLTTFFDQDGNILRQRVTGVLKVELTNLSSGKTVFLNISGPGTFIPQEDGSLTILGEGSWLLLFLANRPGELLFTHGPFELRVTAEGEVLLVDPPPNETDVCALLS